MKVLLVNTFGEGGAAIACRRLHDGLRDMKMNSHLLLKSARSEILQANVFRVKQRPERLIGRLRDRAGRTLRKTSTALGIGPWQNYPTKNQIEFLRARPKGLEFYSFPQSTCDITSNPHYHEADIINLHWVGGFLDWPSFFAKNKKPVIWTLHDQNPFLGGEHYAERFIGIDAEGLPIPRQRTKSEIREEAKLLQLKKHLLQSVKDLHIVAPSKWLLTSSQESELFHRYPHHHIPYGFPTNRFRPLDRAEARRSLGIDSHKKVLLFVADSLKNNRKGFVFIKRAIESLGATERSNLLLCAIGESVALEGTSDFLLELGWVDNEDRMALAYNAADAFVITSLEDNLPNTMIESLLCGTPVLGFKNGGICDAVKDGMNGYLVPEISVSSLAGTIKKVLSHLHTFEKNKIAVDARAKYKSAVQAKTYADLFRNIIENR